MRAGPQAIPPKIKTAAPLSPAVFVGVVLGFVTLGAGAVVFFFNPSTHGFYPECTFHSLTGLNCPGCGATRSLYALLHGNLLLALKDNALFMLTLPALADWGARLISRKLKNQPVQFSLSPKVMWGFLVVALVFGVVRNLPGFEWLSP
ncbi:MAG TPA: DUF2752 domain-containing protein [Candidatus Aquilonibacter sp.]|nr:DUF2752 domain-containing protein [Candidatus Aquilonibacter sp.]